MQCVLYEGLQVLNTLNEHTEIRGEEVRLAYKIVDGGFDSAIADSNFPLVRAYSRN